NWVGTKHTVVVGHGQSAHWRFSFLQPSILNCTPQAATNMIVTPPNNTLPVLAGRGEKSCNSVFSTSPPEFGVCPEPNHPARQRRGQRAGPRYQNRRVALAGGPAEPLDRPGDRDRRDHLALLGCAHGRGHRGDARLALRNRLCPAPSAHLGKY